MEREGRKYRVPPATFGNLTTEALASRSASYVLGLDLEGQKFPLRSYDLTYLLTQIEGTRYRLLSAFAFSFTASKTTVNVPLFNKQYNWYLARASC